MHLDLETDDVEAEVGRIKGFGAIRRDHQVERGLTFGYCATRGETSSVYFSRGFPSR